MAFYLVQQNKFFSKEIPKKYLWSPKKNKNGHNNAGYTNMSKIRTGDYIFHSYQQKIQAFSIASTDSYSSSKDKDHSSALEQEDWRVDLETIVFDTPIIMKEIEIWLRDHYSSQSAFSISGKGKQQYLDILSVEHARFILNYAMDLNEANQIIINFLADVFGDTFTEDYTEIEMRRIEEELNNPNIEEEVGRGPKRQEFSETGRSKRVPKRDTRRAAQALKNADYRCEIDNSHKLFMRKNGETYYTEPHHLIPLSKYADFEPNSLDMPENIVSLCSHCHNLFHYGQTSEMEQALKELHEQRKDDLNVVGLSVSYEQLREYYL